jgi:alcohol dehydrogenase (NADP+)
MIDRASDSNQSFGLDNDSGTYSSPTSAPKLKAVGFAAKHSFSNLKRFEFERPPANADEVELEILYCGVCHSDIHQVKNEWANTVYPCLPGHEIVGRIKRAGSAVTRHRVGDIVGVGCMIDSCGSCGPCRAGDQNYCEGPNSWLATYNGPMVPAAKAPGEVNTYGRDNTYGGYSNNLVVKESFLLKIPSALRPEVAAPILCAGVTTYSPLKHWGVTAGQQVGIVGFGGLGHLACKLAKAMGAEVTVFTHTQEKLEEAGKFGINAVLEKDKEGLERLKSRFDFILSTIPQKHDINPFIELLKRDCTICVVGALEPMEPVNNMLVAFHRKQVAGSLIGNLADTQEVLDFCAEHGIGPDIELIDIKDVNDAFHNVEKGDVRFRYVINMASLDAVE